MPARNPGLDLLRALAILWVMAFHAATMGFAVPGGALRAIALDGWMGVDLFFALSGYLIGTPLLRAWQRGSGPSLAAFWWRRAWRVLPAYWVVLGVYALWPAAREQDFLDPLLRFLTFTLNLGFVDCSQGRAFSHAWSLCVEEHFYLLLPLLAALTTRLRAGPRAVVAALLGAVALGIALRTGTWLWALAPLPRIDEAGGFGPKWLEWLYYPSWCRLDGLVAGVALAAVQVHRPAAWAALSRHTVTLLAAGAMGLAGAAALFTDRTGLAASAVGYPLLDLSLAAFVAAAAACPPHALRCWRVPGAAAVAQVSYSLYLSHKIAFHAARALFGDGAGAASRPGTPALSLAAAALAAVLGTALYLAVERPGLRLRERWRPSRTVTPAGREVPS